jgi:hypothetical protein
LLLSFLVSACSGGGGGSLPLGGRQGPPGPQSSAPLASGTIYAVSAHTINLNGGTNCGYVNVSYTSSTTIDANGYALAPGVYANVYGTGSCATSIAASTISLGAGVSQNSGGASTVALVHVLTADYLGGYAGTKTVTAQRAAPVLTWAEVSIQDANNVAGAGIKTLDYIDPFRQAATDPLYTPDETTFAHDCSGSRIPIYFGSTPQYLMNPGSADLETLLEDWQAGELRSGHIDAFFYDDIDTLYGVSPLPCDPPASSWDSLIVSFIETSQHPVVFNGFAMNADSAGLIALSSVLGGMVEGCYGDASSATAPYTTGSEWIRNENLQLAAAAAQKLFFCYNTPTSDAASSIGLRQYIDASFLLTYAPSSSVLWEYFSTASGLHVFPESEVVPTSPLVSTPGSVSNLQAAGGAYVREYGNCYVDGQSVGACAAVVNPSSGGSVPFPSLSRTYGHTMAISGYGVLDGGSVSAAGPGPPATIPPETGWIVFP